MLAYEDIVTYASDWVKYFDVPYARAVVFGVPIAGIESCCGSLDF